MKKLPRRAGRDSAPLSWKPRRSGKTYCSTACGNGCTVEAYRDAKKNAAELAERLGPDWRPKVWENMGWHYKAVHVGTKIEIYRHGPVTFWATTKTVTPQHHASARTPRVAFERVVRLLRDSAAEFNAILGSV